MVVRDALIGMVARGALIGMVARGALIGMVARGALIGMVARARSSAWSRVRAHRHELRSGGGRAHAVALSAA